VRVANLLAPRIANLYVFGLLQPRGGAGPLITRGAAALAQMILAQEQVDFPLASLLARLRRPSSRMLVGVSETMRDIRAGRLLLSALPHWARLRGRALAEPLEIPPVEASTPPTPPADRSAAVAKIAA
jgi:hypothetical protein